MGARIVWARGLFVVLLGVVTYLTLTPNPDEAEKGFAAARFIAVLLFGDAQLGDKVAHFAGYGALGASAFWAGIKIFAHRRWTPLVLGVYGALLEGVQGLGGVRSPELADALANAFGAFAGFAGAVVLAMVIAKFKPA
jgi:VanZ family protein